LAKSSVHLLAAAYFLGLVLVELYEAGFGNYSLLLSVSILAGTVSLLIFLGIIVSVLTRVVPPWHLMAVAGLAVLVGMGSAFYQRPSGPAFSLCGLQAVYGGFPFPWTMHWVLTGGPTCPILLLPRPVNHGPSLAVFGVDVIFYLASGLGLLQIGYLVAQRRLRRSGRRPTLNHGLG